MRKAVICSKKRYSKKQTVDEQQAVNQDENITLDEVVLMDVDSKVTQYINILDNFYSTSVILEGELSSA